MWRRALQRAVGWLDDVPVTGVVERRQARSIQIFSLIALAYLIAVEIARALHPDRPTPPEVIILIVVSCAALVVARRGYIGWAAASYLIGILAVQGYDLFTGGLAANRFNLIGYALPLTAAGLLLGRRSMWATLAFYAACIAVAGARDQGLLGGTGPQLAPVPPIGPAAQLILILGILAVIVDRFGLTLKNALATTLLRQQEVERSNAALEDEMARRAKAEGQLIEAQRMEAVGQLAGGIAHDFNNALTAVITFCEFASQDLVHDQPAAKDIRQAIGAAEHAARLTRDLLTFTRRRPADPRTLFIEDRIEALVPMLRGVLGEHIALTTRLADNPRPVRIDPQQLEQVLINLTVNARDAMSDGGKLTIETSHPSPDRVRLFVQDTGPGLSPEALLRAFEPFFTTKPAGHGTGLGLATCYGIVTHAGGQIRVSNAERGGAQFEIDLPRSADVAHDRSTVQDAPPEGGSEVILLAEDEPQVRLAAARILRELGYTVLEAGTGQEAIVRAREQVGTLPLVITDVIMPHLDGKALAEWLQANRPNTRVMFISGYGDHVEQELMLRHPATVLRKPFNRDELARAVRAALDRRG